MRSKEATWGPFNNYVVRVLPTFDNPPTYVEKISTLEFDKIKCLEYVISFDITKYIFKQVKNARKFS